MTGDQLLKTAGALLPLVSIAVTGVSGGDVAVALFVIGLAYTAWACAAFLGAVGVWVVDRVRRSRAQDDETVKYWTLYVAFLLAIATPIVWASVWQDGFEEASNDFDWLHVMGILFVAVAALIIGALFTPGRPATTRLCPYCAEKISAQAVKCKHCGSVISAAPHGESAPEG